MTATDRYAVIGNPVTHSRSPFIHAEFARQTGQDLVYTALQAGEDTFESAVQSFVEEGGRGLNVTLPFKHRAYELAHERTARAHEARAVNTLIFQGGKFYGDNTDGAGLTRDLQVNTGFRLKAQRVLLVGAGGAAYGVCGRLLDEAPRSLVVVNRTADKAAELCRHFAVHAQGDALSWRGFDDLEGESFELVVNATSAGLTGGAALPLNGSVFAKGALAYDMVYGRDTPFLTLAKSHGVRAVDGLGMLVEQAAESFEVWRGVRPETRPVIDKLRALGG